MSSSRRSDPSPRSSWLGGSAAIVMLTFDMDGEAPLLAKDPGCAANAMLMSHQEFGPLVGVPRILALLHELAVPATFFIPGLTAERYPTIVEAILTAGHEVGHHSYAHRPYIELTEEEEEEDFEHGLAVLRALGAQVVGHRTPLSGASMRTAALVAHHGLLYESTLMDDDRPYRLHTPNGPIAELPPSWALDDWPQYVFLPGYEPFRIKTVDDVTAGWCLELDAMRREGALFVLTLHPFVHGRASRLEGLQAFITYAHRAGDVAFLGGAELARRVLADPSLSTRSVSHLASMPDPAVYPVL